MVLLSIYYLDNCIYYGTCSFVASYLLNYNANRKLIKVYLCTCVVG